MFAVAMGTNVSTPLLLLYQTRLDLSSWTVTALFAVYPLGLLPALLWGGPASDVLGRRPLTRPSLIASAAASLMFAAGASSLPVLFVARFLLGAVSGVAFVVMTAWMQELAEPEDRPWAARLTGMVLYAGFGLGPLMSGALGQWAPLPLVLPYLVHVGVVAVGVVMVWTLPETVAGRVSRRIRPDLGLEPDTAPAFWRVVAPTSMAVFGFPSLAFGLFPVLLRPVMAGVAVFVAGLVAGITALAIFATQRVSIRLGPLRAAPVSLATGTVGAALGAIAFVTDWWGLLFPAAVALGAASGLAVTSGLRFVDLLADPERRGAMTGSFYGLAYAAMTLPVVVSSLAGPGGFALVLFALTGLGGAGAALLGRSVRRFPELNV